MMNKKLYPLLISLYLAQGIPAGLSAHALPVLLREQGVSLSVITLMNALALPWLLKFIWAPWLDGIKARARTIAIIQVIVSVVFLSLALLTLQQWLSSYLLLFITLLVVINLLMASHDVLTDGLAVRLLDANQRGFGNVFQVAGYKIGMVIGGSLLLWFIASSDWLLANVSLAFILLFLAAVVLLLAKPFTALLQQVVPKSHLDDDQSKGSSKELSHAKVQLLTTWRGFLSQPAMILWLIVVMSYKLGDALVSSIIRPMWVDFGFDIALIGGVGVAAIIASVIGAIIGGIMYRYQSAFCCLVIAGLFQCLGLLGYAYCAWVNPDLSVWVAVFNLEQCIDGASTVVLFAAMMAVCRKTFAGSDYTLQASLFLMITGGLKLVSGYLAQSFGYVSFFVLAAALFIIPLFVLVHLYHKNWFDWFDARQ